MIEVAEELIEAVIGRQHLVSITEMVLAELAGRVAKRLQQFRDGRVFLRHALGSARPPDLGQSGPDWGLPRDEGGAAGRAALLPIPIGKHRALAGDAIDVGRLVAHHAPVIRADVEAADVIAPDDQDVRSLLRLLSVSRSRDDQHGERARSYR